MAKRTGIKIRQLVILTFAWVIIGLFISLYDFLLLLSSNSPTEAESLVRGLIINCGTGLVGALIGGTVLVFIIHDKLKDHRYGYSVVLIVVVFALVVVTVVVLKRAIFGDVILDSAATRIKNALIWFAVVCLTQLILQMNTRTGNAFVGNFIQGRYNVPRAERNIFMFLDINSSTTIAEELGDDRYHGLLRDFFSDIADPILESEGAIYQYVGDEVIVAWNYEEGLKNNRCITCFYDIKRKINQNAEKYRLRYGLIPTFKAGFHCGRVVAGEVGTLRREVTYSGDVLNTTARILALCRNYGAEVLASGSLLSQLCLDKTFEVLELGRMKLHGKQTEVLLNAIKGQ